MSDSQDLWLTRDLRLGDQYTLTASFDSRAEGHWARVVGARRHDQGDVVALKIMRRAHLASDAVYKMFCHEARLLDHLGRHEATRDRINALRGCGYVRPAPQPRPGRVDLEWCANLDEFEGQIPARRPQWLPFLALETIPFERSLLHLAGGLSRAPNQMLPLAEWLDIARQGLRVLAACHDQRIFYIDHKLEHVMWDGKTLRFIDWNVTDWEQDGTGGAPPWSAAIVRHKTWRDLRHFTALVLFPLLARHTIDTESANPTGGPASVRHGRRPIEAHSGNVSIDRIHLPQGRLDFHEDGTPLFDDDLKSLLTRAVQNDPDLGYESAGQYLAALEAYGQRWRETAEGFDTYLTGYTARVRDIQRELREVEEGLQELLREVTGQVGSQPRGVYLEIGRLYRSVKDMRRNIVLPERGGPP